MVCLLLNEDLIGDFLNLEKKFEFVEGGVIWLELEFLWLELLFVGILFMYRKCDDCGVDCVVVLDESVGVVGLGCILVGFWL